MSSQNSFEIINSLKLDLLYTEFKQVGPWWNYKNVISPFSRIYLITEGEGWVSNSEQEFHLVAGKLFLIPPFTRHSYRCDESMDHYYICFFDSIEGALSIWDLLHFNFQVGAGESDYRLMKRLQEINPGRQLPDYDPINYDNKPNLLSVGRGNNPAPGLQLETNGILLQLFSRFATEKKELPDLQARSYTRIYRVTSYIQGNLDKKLSLDELASLIYLNPEYFSRLFKQVMGVKPNEYITRKRIEKAQVLLVTSGLSLAEIAVQAGIPNISYFFTCFKKYTQVSPEEFKRMNAGIQTK